LFVCFVLFVVVAKFANLFFSSGHMFEFFLQLVTLEEKQSFSGAFFPRATTGEGEGRDRDRFFWRDGGRERERERPWVIFSHGRTLVLGNHLTTGI
jgi:hypothetical protein